MLAPPRLGDTSDEGNCKGNAMGEGFFRAEQIRQKAL